MKRSVLALGTFVAVSTARAADLATTFHFNPSLSREANPLVTWHGADPKALLIFNVVGLAILFLAPLFLYWRGRPKVLAEKAESVWDFASLLLYDRIMPKGRLIRAFLLGSPLPKDWFQFLRLWGFAGCWALAIGSFIVTFSWWAVSDLHWTTYQTIRSSITIGSYPVLELVPVIPTFIAAAVIFFRTEFCDYKRALTAPHLAPR